MSADRCRRLREAVRLAGGQTALAARSGAKMRTLSNYLVGRNDMKAEALVAIADACGVSIEWLAAGRGPMRPSETLAATTIEDASPDRLSRALSDVRARFDAIERDIKLNANPCQKRAAPAQPSFEEALEALVVHHSGRTDTIRMIGVLKLQLEACVDAFWLPPEVL